MITLTSLMRSDGIRSLVGIIPQAIDDSTVSVTREAIGHRRALECAYDKPTRGGGSKRHLEVDRAAWLIGYGRPTNDALRQPAGRCFDVRVGGRKRGSGAILTPAQYDGHRGQHNSDISHDYHYYNGWKHRA